MSLWLLLDPHLWHQTLVYAAPLIIAALGELIIERSGVLNIGIEGMMLVAAVTCFVVTWQTRSAAAGIGVGMGAAAILALLLVYYAVALGGAPRSSRSASDFTCSAAGSPRSFPASSSAPARARRRSRRWPRCPCQASPICR